jgi:hypothetical protein
MRAPHCSFPFFLQMAAKRPRDAEEGEATSSKRAQVATDAEEGKEEKKKQAEAPSTTVVLLEAAKQQENLITHVPEHYNLAESTLARRSPEERSNITQRIYHNERARTSGKKGCVIAALNATEALLREYAAELKAHMIMNELADDPDGEHDTFEEFHENVEWDCCKNGEAEDGCDEDHSKEVSIDPREHVEERHRKQVAMWHEVRSLLPVSIRHTAVMEIVAAYAACSYTNQLLDMGTNDDDISAASLVNEHTMNLLPYALYATPVYRVDGCCLDLNLAVDWRPKWEALSQEEQNAARRDWGTSSHFYYA